MDESTLPRDQYAWFWLKANPHAGVAALDRSDGLGPRLVGWDYTTMGPGPTAAQCLNAWTNDPERIRQAAIDADRATVRAIIANPPPNAAAMTSDQWQTLLRVIGRSL